MWIYSIHNKDEVFFIVVGGDAVDPTSLRVTSAVIPDIPE